MNLKYILCFFILGIFLSIKIKNNTTRKNLIVLSLLVLIYCLYSKDTIEGLGKNDYRSCDVGDSWENSGTDGVLLVDKNNTVLQSEYPEARPVTKLPPSCKCPDDVLGIFKDGYNSITEEVSPDVWNCRIKDSIEPIQVPIPCSPGQKWGINKNLSSHHPLNLDNPTLDKVDPSCQCPHGFDKHTIEDGNMIRCIDKSHNFFVKINKSPLCEIKVIVSTNSVAYLKKINFPIEILEKRIASMIQIMTQNLEVDIKKYISTVWKDSNGDIFRNDGIHLDIYNCDPEGETRKQWGENPFFYEYLTDIDGWDVLIKEEHQCDASDVISKGALKNIPEDVLHQFRKQRINKHNCHWNCCVYGVDDSGFAGTSVCIDNIICPNRDNMDELFGHLKPRDHSSYNNAESVFIHEFAHLIMKSGLQDINERSKKFMVKPLGKEKMNIVQSMDRSISSIDDILVQELYGHFRGIFMVFANTPESGCNGSMDYDTLGSSPYNCIFDEFFAEASQIWFGATQRLNDRNVISKNINTVEKMKKIKDNFGISLYDYMYRLYGSPINLCTDPVHDVNFIGCGFCGLQSLDSRKDLTIPKNMVKGELEEVKEEEVEEVEEVKEVEEKLDILNQIYQQLK